MAAKRKAKKDWGRILLVSRLEKTVESRFVLVWSNLIAKGLRQGKNPDMFALAHEKTAHKAANDLARVLLVSGADTIAYIDSDCDVGEAFLEDLRTLEDGWEYDIFQAFYTRRGFPPEAIWFQRTEFGDMMQCVIRDPEHTADVSGVGLHCTLIRKEVFIAMLDNRPPDVDPEKFEWFYYPRHKAISEDMAFSNEAEKLGFKMGATTKVKAGHISRVTVGWETYQQWMKLTGVDKFWLAYDEVITKVAEFTEQERETVVAKVGRAQVLLKEQWEKKQPKTPDEVRAFYGQDNTPYFYDLIAWNYSKGYRQILKALERYKGKRILNIGAGIGTEATLLVNLGNHVDMFELPGALRKFLLEKILRVPPKLKLTLMMRESLLEMDVYPEYDAVTAIDVLEHIHPDELAATLDQMLGMMHVGGELFLHNSFDNQETYPMHFAENEEIFHQWCRDNSIARTDQFVWQRVSKKDKEQVS